MAFEIQQTTKLDWVLVRSNMAGVLFGQLYNKNGSEYTLKNARRIWSWQGALDCSVLATLGPGKPNECVVSCATATTIVNEVDECIEITPKALAVLRNIAETNKQS